MLKFQEFITENEDELEWLIEVKKPVIASELSSKEKEKRVSDSKGKLFEILVGSYMQHGAGKDGLPIDFISHYRDEKKKSPREVHDEAREILGDVHYGQLVQHAREAASHIQKHLSENGHKKISEVAWTSQPGDHKQFTGDNDPNSAADIMLKSAQKDETETPIGVSLKYGAGKDPNLKNPGMESLEGLAGLNPGELDVHRQNHRKLLQSLGMKPGESGSDQFKQMLKDKHPDAERISTDALETQKKIAASVHGGLSKLNQAQLHKVITDLIAPETKHVEYRHHTRVLLSGEVEHHTANSKEHVSTALARNAEYRVKPHTGSVAVTIQRREHGSDKWVPAVNVGVKKTRTYSGMGFAAATQAPMLTAKAKPTKSGEAKKPTIAAVPARINVEKAKVAVQKKVKAKKPAEKLGNDGTIGGLQFREKESV